MLPTIGDEVKGRNTGDVGWLSSPLAEILFELLLEFLSSLPELILS
jgi:hypothetical protein